MFCDLVGSTALSERLDPEDMRDLLLEYRKLCGEIVDRHKGLVAQFYGDGILIYFGYPKAHEDDAARALRAGLEIVPAMRPTSNSAGKERRIWIRDGHRHRRGRVGDTRRRGRRQNGGVVGETPNVAARVQSDARQAPCIATSSPCGRQKAF